MVACDPSGRLTSEQVARFRKDGFLVLEGFATPDEVRAMLTRADELVDGFDPATHPRSVFSTVDQKRTSDAYFLDSGNHVSFFFEERAFDRDGKLAQDKRLSINKMGHAMHDLDPTFRAFSRSEKMAALLASLEVNKPVPVQSMYIFKNPVIGGEGGPPPGLHVPPHPTRHVRGGVGRPRGLHENQRMFVGPPGVARGGRATTHDGAPRTGSVAGDGRHRIRGRVSGLARRTRRTVRSHRVSRGNGGVVARRERALQRAEHQRRE